MKSRSIKTRCLILLAALSLMSFGIAFITSAGLGTSQISGIPYVLSLLLPGTFGEWTWIVNALFVAAEWLIMKRQWHPQLLFQLLAAAIFSFFIDLGMYLVQEIQPQSYEARAAFLFFGCFLLSAGICGELKASLTMTPGEGIVQVLSIRTGTAFDRVKISFDCFLVLSALCLSWFGLGRIEGIREGTLAAALLTGPMIRLIHSIPFPKKADCGQPSDKKASHTIK